MSQALSLDAARPAFRSIGVKLIVVCFLAFMMTIPALFVWALIEDRSSRADEVVKEVGAMVGGPQTFLGPVVAIPYTQPNNPGKPPHHGVYIVFPARGEATVNIQTEVRHRSLFKVPVYRSEIVFNAAFDLTGVPANAPEGALLDWSRAEFLVGAGDPRGAQSDIKLDSGGKTFNLTASAALPPMNFNVLQDGLMPLHFFGAATGGPLQPGARFDVTANLKFAGVQRLVLLPFANTTEVKMKGDWPHPSFNGGALPVAQNLHGGGFEAAWTVPSIARGAQSEGPSDIVCRLGQSAIGVSFIQLTDPYQSVTRSLKYALLFIALVFLSYFLFEVTSRKRVHPAQYLLIGVAQIIFYLLLLSIAERLGFDWAFLIAAVATVGLISVYARWVFDSRKYGLRALASFSLLYAFIYLLLRLEDEALLLGAVASFAAISAVMYFTRHMDWYSSSATPAPLPQTAPPGDGRKVQFEGESFHD